MPCQSRWFCHIFFPLPQNCNVPKMPIPLAWSIRGYEAEPQRLYELKITFVVLGNWDFIFASLTDWFGWEGKSLIWFLPGLTSTVWSRKSSGRFLRMNITSCCWEHRSSLFQLCNTRATVLFSQFRAERPSFRKGYYFLPTLIGNLLIILLFDALL